ncbi:MAG TPA: LpxD N-terminal domain-containing protein, partial [Pyrinomonadaceae bacterium]
MIRDEQGKTAAELAALVGGRVVGDAGATVRRVASLEAAGEGDVAFVEDEKLFESARACRASCVIAPEGSAPRLEGLRSLIEAARPKLAFALVAEALRPPVSRAASVHPVATVAEGATLGEGVYVGAGAFVGAGAEVGAG